MTVRNKFAAPRPRCATCRGWGFVGDKSPHAERALLETKTHGTCPDCGGIGWPSQDKCARCGSVYVGHKPGCREKA